MTTLFVSHELQTFDQKVDVQKHSIVNSFLLIDTVKSTCKVAEKSTTVSIAKFSKFISKERAESRIRIAYLFAKLKASHLNLSLNTFVIILETMKNTSIQEVACVRTLCKSCKQNFNFNKKFFEHINEHETLKRINTIIVTFSQFVSSKCSNFQLRALNFASKSKKSILIQRIIYVRTICKRCNQIFNFNNKFHKHIRQHHARKFVISKNFDFRVFALKFTYKIAEKSIMIFSSVSHASSILFATSRSQIFSTKMSSRSVSHKDSHLSIARLKITSKSIKKLSVNCSFTFSFSSFRIYVRNFHESHIQKSHLIMNDLSRIFHEKFKSFDLRQHYNRRSFSQSFDIRQSHFSSSSIKSHLIVENLCEMFDEKFRKKNLSQDQKNVSFREFFSKQSRIIVYFKFAINRKSSINQNSKSSKSKSLNQHMFAKSIRIVFNKNFFEKSIDLSYKLSNVFCHQKSSKFRTFAKISFFIFILLRLFSIFLIALAFVSILSIAKISYINVYEQVFSIIDCVVQ